MLTCCQPIDSSSSQNTLLKKGCVHPCTWLVLSVICAVASLLVAYGCTHIHAIGSFTHPAPILSLIFGGFLSLIFLSVYFSKCCKEPSKVTLEANEEDWKQLNTLYKAFQVSVNNLTNFIEGKPVENASSLCNVANTYEELKPIRIQYLKLKRLLGDVNSNNAVIASKMDLLKEQVTTTENKHLLNSFSQTYEPYVEKYKALKEKAEEALSQIEQLIKTNEERINKKFETATRVELSKIAAESRQKKQEEEDLYKEIAKEAREQREAFNS